MATIAEIEAGAARYIDEEVAPKIPTNVPYGQVKKIAAVAGAIYAVKHKLGRALANPAVASIGAVDKDGDVDVDGIAEAFLSQVPEDGFKADVPILGELTFSREDVSKLVKYIKEARV